MLTGQENAVRKAERKQELVKKLEKKYRLKDRKETLKHRREIQTKATQQRMSAADKRARKYNRANRPDWIEDLFSRKRPKR